MSNFEDLISAWLDSIYIEVLTRQNPVCSKKQTAKYRVIRKQEAERNRQYMCSNCGQIKSITFKIPKP